MMSQHYSKIPILLFFRSISPFNIAATHPGKLFPSPLIPSLSPSHNTPDTMQIPAKLSYSFKDSYLILHSYLSHTSLIPHFLSLGLPFCQTHPLGFFIVRSIQMMLYFFFGQVCYTNKKMPAAVIPPALLFLNRENILLLEQQHFLYC
jgi:hypothetical protein